MLQLKLNKQENYFRSKIVNALIDQFLLDR